MESTSNATLQAELLDLPSAAKYRRTKSWVPTTMPYAFSVGEVGRRGRHSPERYLDDRGDLLGTRVKMLCRTSGALPVMERVGREQRPSWPRHTRRCMVCGTGAVESVRHFVAECPAYAAHRATLERQVRGILNSADCEVDGHDFDTMSSVLRSRLLLGQQMGDPIAEDKIDRCAKVFLKKAWRAREQVERATNMVLGTKYAVFAAPSR